MDTAISSSLQTSQTSFCREPILQYPCIEKPYIFSPMPVYAYSGILTQAVDSPENLRPVTFTSGLFSEIQQRWSATQKEANAGYQSVLKFDLYSSGAHCVLCCNQKVLAPFCLKALKFLGPIGGLQNKQTITLRLYTIKINTISCQMLS